MSNHFDALLLDLICSYVDFGDLKTLGSMFRVSQEFYHFVKDNLTCPDIFNFVSFYGTIFNVSLTMSQNLSLLSDKSILSEIKDTKKSPWRNMRGQYISVLGPREFYILHNGQIRVMHVSNAILKTLFGPRLFPISNVKCSSIFYHSSEDPDHYMNIKSIHKRRRKVCTEFIPVGQDHITLQVFLSRLLCKRNINNFGIDCLLYSKDPVPCHIYPC